MRASCTLVLMMLASASALGGQSRESWLVTTDLWGNPCYQVLELERNGRTLGGRFDGIRIEGEQLGHVVRFDAASCDGALQSYAGSIDAGVFSGKTEYPDGQRAPAHAGHAFSARRLPDPRVGSPARHEFTPTEYANEFSPHRKPVLTIWPGDSVHTSTIDSGGVDEQGVTRALFGNPQTGPFYIGSAAPGDTLVVRIVRLRLNRDYADSLDGIAARAAGGALAASATVPGKPVRWTLDRLRGVARPEASGGALGTFEIPLKPMLGGLAVAPGFGSAPMSTGDTGRSGGNMDFNEVVEGAIVYLPVFQPGALLYLGDAHAAQGDGETSQYALETSMDVEFSVDVVHGTAIRMPRVESPTRLMVLGQAGSLDDALRAATGGLAEWLQRDYPLDLPSTAQVFGTSIHYTVANLAGRSVGVCASIDKATLSGIARREP